jgi:hypothetical protein
MRSALGKLAGSVVGREPRVPGAASPEVVHEGGHRPADLKNVRTTTRESSLYRKPVFPSCFEERQGPGRHAGMS